MPAVRATGGEMNPLAETRIPMTNKTFEMAGID
jgi:hypothetical protein